MCDSSNERNLCMAIAEFPPLGTRFTDLSPVKCKIWRLFLSLENFQIEIKMIDYPNWWMIIFFTFFYIEHVVDIGHVFLVHPKLFYFEAVFRKWI